MTALPACIFHIIGIFESQLEPNLYMLQSIIIYTYSQIFKPLIFVAPEKITRELKKRECVTCGQALHMFM